MHQLRMLSRVLTGGLREAAIRRTRREWRYGALMELSVSDSTSTVLCVGEEPALVNEEGLAA